ncbi:MAG TPA: anti-sigma factor [Thermoleophilaceae bacterium]|nr:anti-sigma factor [Thermoleophilaceae bacterium]
MATFDQLPAEQRAILELVVGRGQSYDELSGMLGMPAPRVRELAREALGELAPATAARVDPDWRGQIADYVLGQQSGPESTATKSHFKRSEPARAWAYSLLDSLGHLYPNRGMPEIPEASAGAPAPPSAPEPAVPAAAPRPQAPGPRPQAARSGGALSPAAQAIVRRRRIIGGAIAAAVIVVAILAIAGVFSGGGSKHNGGASTVANGTTGGTPTKFLREGVLKAVGNEKGTGIAVVLQQGNQVQLVVQATNLQPTDRQTAYEVWLYNSANDAAPLGAQFTDQQGNLQGRGGVPGNWQSFKYVVLSREKVGTNPKTPSGLVLRATLTAVPTKGATGATGTTGG